MEALTLVLPLWSIGCSIAAVVICWRSQRRGLRCWRLTLGFTGMASGPVLLAGIGIIAWLAVTSGPAGVPSGTPWVLITAVIAMFVGALLAAYLLLVGVLDLARIHARELAEREALRRDLRELGALVGEA